jgi:hypothetical protein
METQTLPDRTEILDVPPHVASWSVAKIPGFVSAVLRRWQREHGRLPERFVMLMCPQAEINAMGGLPPRVVELTDARLRCRHFTGCHRPYFVVLFMGEGAEERRAQIQGLLGWSEGYGVEVTPSALRLTYAGATEDVAAMEDRGIRARTVRDLLETGELVSVLG